MKGPLCAGPVTGKLRSITEGRVRVESRNGSPWSPLAFFLLFSPHPHPEKKQMFWEVEAERRTVRRPHPLALESWGRGRPDCRPPTPLPQRSLPAPPLAFPSPSGLLPHRASGAQ